MKIARITYAGIVVFLSVFLAFFINSCGGSGSTGGSGQGAAFAKSFGGDQDARMVAMLPLGDGFLMVGSVDEHLSAGRLDANGDLVGSVMRNSSSGEFGMSTFWGFGQARAVTPAEGGWISGRFDSNTADNSYQLVVTRYQTGVTLEASPSQLWRSQENVYFQNTSWHGGSAHLTRGTDLLALKSQSASGTWKGVLALVRETAFVDMPISGGTQREWRARYMVWSFNSATGALDSVTELDEWEVDPAAPGYSIRQVEWSIGANGVYLVHVFGGDPRLPEKRYWGLQGGVSSQTIPSSLSVDSSGHLNGGLLWSEGSELKRMDTQGSITTVTDLAGDVHAGETIDPEIRIVCPAVDTCRVFAKTSDQELLVWDQDGYLLQRVAVTDDLDGAMFTIDQAAVGKNGDLLLVLQLPEQRRALTRIKADFSQRSTTYLDDEVPLNANTLLSDGNLMACRDDTTWQNLIQDEFQDILSIHDGNFNALYSMDSAMQGADEREVKPVQAIGRANDQAFVLMQDGSMMRLNGETPQSQLPAPTLDDGQRVYTLGLYASSDSQGYLTQYYLPESANATTPERRGWSAHDSDGSQRWALELSGPIVNVIYPDDTLGLAGGDTLLVGYNSIYITIARVDGNGSKRWLHAYDTSDIDDNDIYIRSAELSDGNLLIALMGESSIRLLKIDGSDGTVLLYRKLKPNSGGHTSYMSPGFDMARTEDGKVWLGFTSYKLVWHETIPSGSGYTTLPYGATNLAFIRLNEQLQPDRLRVYGAGGDERLAALNPVSGGGLLVAATTDSIGLGSGENDAWVMRLDAEGMVGSDCQAVLLEMESSMAIQYMGTSDPLTMNMRADIEMDVIVKPIRFQTVQPAEPATPFISVDQEAARMCLAGLGEVPASEENHTLTLVIDGGSDLGPVYIWSGEEPVHLLDCSLDGPTTTTCTAAYTPGSTVTLYSSVFGPQVLEWEGCIEGLDAYEQPVCTLDMDSAQRVYAHLNPTHTLTLTMDGQMSQGATVYSDDVPPSLYCSSPSTTGTTCSAEIPEGEVLLKWNDYGGYGLITWSGCTPEPNETNTTTFCRLDMDADYAVTATFGPASTLEKTLTVVIEGGPGAGEVRSGESPTPQLDCINSNESTTTCTTTYTSGSNVTLYGESYSGLNLTWSGCTPGMDIYERPACLLTMDADITVTATFAP